MAHVFVGVEWRKVWGDLFLADLLKRRYPYKDMDGLTRMVQPNPREIKFYNISLPKECIPYLMRDIAPYAGNSPASLYSPLKNKAGTIARVARLIGGLKPFKPIPDSWVVRIPFVGKFLNKIVKLFKTEPALDYKASGEVRHQWINVMPIGWKEDNYDPSSDMRYLPKGGELV